MDIHPLVGLGQGTRACLANIFPVQALQYIHQQYPYHFHRVNATHPPRLGDVSWFGLVHHKFIEKLRYLESITFIHFQC